MTTSDAPAPPIRDPRQEAPRLADIVKTYDVRGLVDQQLVPEASYALGWAFARFVALQGHLRHMPTSAAAQDRAWQTVVVAHDMRRSSPALAAAFAGGVNAAGLDVVHAGLASTDMLYYASGALRTAGAMFTASHNPARYNGIKLCLPGAAPLSIDNGLSQIRDQAQALLDKHIQQPSAPRGRLLAHDVLPGYTAFLRSLVDLSGIRPLRVVVDAGNGMAGYTVPTVLGGLPVQVDELYFELDGDFPNHEPNPLDPSNLVDLQHAVRSTGADLGLAFDGDADRCFVIDEQGNPISASAITALVGTRELARRPGATILHNLITSRAVPEIIAEAGGLPIRTRVGHSLIKASMASTGAVFGGEHSAHYYFADFFGADTGMLAAMHVLAALGEQDRPLSQLVASYERYSSSGEINSTVSDVPTTLGRIREWALSHGAEIDDFDGLTVSLANDSWFNVRASNTEPLLRLNVEAPDDTAMADLRNEILALVRAG